jgi:hypothetical protein
MTARTATAKVATKLVAPVPALKPRHHRHLVCRSAAMIAGALVAAFICAVFDNRECVDITGGEIYPPAQHIGGTIRVTWHMKPHTYCDGEVTDFYRHYSGFHQTGDVRLTSYAKLWDGTPGKEFDFISYKIVPDGLEGNTTYEPIIRRWHNPFQKYLNPIRVTGVVIPFVRLPKPLALVPGAPPVVPVVPLPPVKLPPDAIKAR